MKKITALMVPLVLIGCIVGPEGNDNPSQNSPKSAIVKDSTDNGNCPEGSIPAIFEWGPGCEYLDYIPEKGP